MLNEFFQFLRRKFFTIWQKGNRLGEKLDEITHEAQMLADSADKDFIHGRVTMELLEKYDNKFFENTAIWHFTQSAGKYSIAAHKFLEAAKMQANEEQKNTLEHQSMEMLACAEQAKISAQTATNLRLQSEAKKAEVCSISKDHEKFLSITEAETSKLTFYPVISRCTNQ